MEEWKTVEIDGVIYEDYEVSTEGRVRSLKYGKIKLLKPQKVKDGYLQITLWKQGYKKIFYVHRTVANAFIPNPDNLPEINHINEDKTDNRVENLEWCDRDYNIHHGTGRERQQKSMLGKNGKRIKCIETGVIYDSARQVERETGIAHQNISKVLKGKLKSCGGYTWEYV